MNVIRQSGNWYLVDLGDGRGRVLDLDYGRFFPPMSLVSLLAKGGWEQFHGDQQTILDRVGEAENLSGSVGRHMSVA